MDRITGRITLSDDRTYIWLPVAPVVENGLVKDFVGSKKPVSTFINQYLGCAFIELWYRQDVRRCGRQPN